jgi:5,10-methylenetetrahydromethanopterin reductase
MDVSVAFATTLQSPEHVRIAEDLGYSRAWLYDTPQQSPDVWMTLALAAKATVSIGLGPGVLVPTLRHPMVNAAGAAGLEHLAPGRVAVGFGTGFTGRRAMGQSTPIPWAYMASYISVFRALLRGETVEWDGGLLRMLHDDTAAASRPIEVPVYIGALGPKGLQVARDLADGLFVATSVPEGANEFNNVAYLVWGTVLDDGETPTDERVRAAAGPGLAQRLHGAFEIIGEDVVAKLPGGDAWLQAVRAIPEQERHLAVHDGHCLRLNEADEAAWSAGLHTGLRHFTVSGSADEVRQKVDAYAGQGVTEIVYQPVADVRRELERFAAAVAN